MLLLLLITTCEALSILHQKFISQSLMIWQMLCLLQSIVHPMLTILESIQLLNLPTFNLISNPSLCFLKMSIVVWNGEAKLTTLMSTSIRETKTEAIFVARGFWKRLALVCFLVRLVLYVTHGSNVKNNQHPSSSISLWSFSFIEIKCKFTICTPWSWMCKSLLPEMIQYW